jgi:hypothetical protein
MWIGGVEGKLNMFDKLVNRLRVAWWGWKGGVRYAFKRSLEEWRRQNSDEQLRRLLAAMILADVYMIVSQTLLDRKVALEDVLRNREEMDEYVSSLYQ